MATHQPAPAANLPATCHTPALSLPRILERAPMVPVMVPAEAMGMSLDPRAPAPPPVRLALPTRLEEHPTSTAIQQAVADALETDETRLARLEANGRALLAPGDMDAVKARIGWLVEAIDGPRVTPEHLAAWLWPKNLACSRPETPTDFHYRVAGLAFMLGDLPASLFTAETVRLLRTKWFPGDAEIREALEPALARWKRELAGLRRLKPSGGPAPMRGPALDPAETDETVARYEAMPDGPVRRRGVAMLLTRLERNPGGTDLLDRYGERLRLLNEIPTDRQGRTTGADDWRDPADGTEPEPVSGLGAVLAHRTIKPAATISPAMAELKRQQAERVAAAMRQVRAANPLIGRPAAE